MHAVSRELRIRLLHSVLLTLCAVAMAGAAAHANDTTASGPAASVQAALTLSAAGQPFGAHYAAASPTRPTTPSRGGAILLLGPTGDSGQPGIMTALRRALTKDGWTTLSVELPPPTPPGDDPSNFVAAVDARLNSAIAYLHHHGISNLVIVSGDLGINAGAQYLGRHPGRRIRAFVDVGTGARNIDPIPAPIPTIAAGTPALDIEIPTLVIRPDGSLPMGGKQATPQGPREGEKSAAAKGVHTPSADTQRDSLLVRRVRAWLRRHAARVGTPHSLRTAKQ